MLCTLPGLHCGSLYLPGQRKAPLVQRGDRLPKAVRGDCKARCITKKPSWERRAFCLVYPLAFGSFTNFTNAATARALMMVSGIIKVPL